MTFINVVTLYFIAQEKMILVKLVEKQPKNIIK